MSENPNVPSTWYKYDWPLADNDNLPKPSNANYSPKNVAWMIEMFAKSLSRNPDELVFLYENNTPKIYADDIAVSHPLDRLYLPEKQEFQEKSNELLLYEEYAKVSNRLKLFQDNSPAKIEYFKDKKS